MFLFSYFENKAEPSKIIGPADLGAARAYRSPSAIYLALANSPAPLPPQNLRPPARSGAFSCCNAAILRSNLASKPAGQGRVAGFTLVELMVTIVVSAILLAIAMPSFRDMILAHKLATAADGVVAAIQTARMEAIKRNAPAQFCGSTPALNTNDALGLICGGQIGAVHAADNANPPHTTPILDAASGIWPPVQFSGDVIALRFNSQGMGAQPSDPIIPFNGDVAKLCAGPLSSNNIYIIHMTSGAIIKISKSTGDCA